MENNPIFTRRSVTRYTDEDVDEGSLRKILEAGMCAPSRGNQKVWHFIVIRHLKLLDEIPRIHPEAGMCHHAPVAVLVCGDTSMETQEGTWALDCAAAVENMLLEAHHLKLGAVWVGIHPDHVLVEEFKAKFHLPECVIPLAIVPIGHPAETPEPKKDRYFEDRVHLDFW